MLKALGNVIMSKERTFSLKKKYTGKNFSFPGSAESKIAVLFFVWSYRDSISGTFFSFLAKQKKSRIYHLSNCLPCNMLDIVQMCLNDSLIARANVSDLIQLEKCL